MTKKQLINAINAIDNTVKTSGLDKAKLEAKLAELQANVEQPIDYVTRLEEAYDIQTKQYDIYKTVLDDLQTNGVAWGDISNHLRDSHLMHSTSTVNGKKVVTEWPVKHIASTGKDKPIGINEAAKVHKGARILAAFNTYRSTFWSDYGVPKEEKKVEPAKVKGQKKTAGQKTGKAVVFDKEKVFAGMLALIAEEVKDQEKNEDCILCLEELAENLKFTKQLEKLQKA